MQVGVMSLSVTSSGYYTFWCEKQPQLIAVPGETQETAQAFGHTWEQGQGAMMYEYSSLQRILIVREKTVTYILLYWGNKAYIYS